MTQVIVVGAGHWGRNLVRNFSELGALSGIVELDPYLREELAKEYPGVSLYENYDQALQSEVSAFIIATPAPTHYKISLKALQAGKDVFIEKPITLRIDEARHLAEYAHLNNQVLMVGHLLLYQPAIRWMEEYLATGKAGKVLHIAAQRVKLGKVRQNENVWWSFAPHDISVVLQLLGQPKLKSITASGQAMLQPEIEDNVHVHLTFEDGATAHIHSSWYWPQLARNTVIIASQQMLLYDEVSQKITIYNKGVDGEFNTRDEGSEVIEIQNPQPLRTECQHFIDCVKSRESPISDGWNGVAVVEILEKASELLHG